MKTISDILQKLSGWSCGLFISDGINTLSSAEFSRRVIYQADIWRANNISNSSILLIPSFRGLPFFIELTAAWLIGATAVPFSGKPDKFFLDYLLHALKGPYTQIDTELTETIHWKNSDYVQAGSILFTSGSSGTPKGVIHRLENLLGNARSTCASIDLSSSDHLFINIPYHFTSAICHFLSWLLAGASFTAIEEKLFPKDLIQTMDNIKANCFGGSPLQLAWFAHSSHTLMNQAKWFMSSGDDLQMSVTQDLQLKYPNSSIYTVYGLTEIGGRGCILQPADFQDNKGSVGLPVNGLSVSVRDENQFETPVGEIGEIYFSGEFLLSGFVEKNYDTEITEYGYKTGDIGEINKNGYVFIRGRRDDVFKVAGQKVSGLRIRSAIMNSGLVTDAAIIAQSDATLGNIPAAILVPNQGNTIDKGLLIKYLRSELPANQIPKYFYLANSIQRTDTGKIVKKSLQENLAKYRPL